MSGRLPKVEDLSPEQRQVVDAWGHGISVLAGAGSGKTTTLVVKCAELMRRKPDARFCAVSFTERSASDLRAKLAERLATGDGSAGGGHWVMTIHGLCGAILREYPREAGFDGEETTLAEPEAQLLWERAIEGLWFDELPEPVRAALDRLLARETRASLEDLLKRLRELEGFGVLAKLDEAGSPDGRALRELGAWVLERYDRLKRRRGAIDFSDLEKGADRALEHPAVREAFRRRFDLVLVDEFQDTNPLQARIILRFCREDLSNLCVVGDPKQSIYRFRDADVSVFEDFCRRLPGRFALTWNFRSRAPIIDYANRLCQPLFEASGMPYEALVPRREAEPGFDSVARLDVASPADLGRWIRAQTGAGVPLHDMALLLRKIRGNEKWLKALTSAGIPIAVGSGGLFWEDPRVRELVALLRWWDNPGNALSAAVFLRSPWVAIPDIELDRWIRRDPTALTTFMESEHPLAVALRPLRGRVIRPGELLMAVLHDDAIEAELGSQLLGLWHRVEELSARGLDFHGVVRELVLAVEKGRRERDVPPPRNGGQLAVLTLHSSKGLEFPHVLLLDLGSKPRGADAPLLFWDREKGAHLAGRDANGDRDRKDPVEAAWREDEKAKSLAESKRLFYVAVTRARERLVLVCPPLTEKEQAKAAERFEPEQAFGVDDWRAWVEACPGEPLPRLTAPAAEGSAARSAGELPPVADSAAPRFRPVARRWRGIRPRHSVTEWNLLARCPRAYEWKYVRPVIVAEGIREIGLFTGEKAPSPHEEELSDADLGSRVHACLENGDYAGLRSLEVEVGAARFQAEPLVSWAMSCAWMAPARPENGREVWTELAFEVPAGPEILVGSIDRLVAEPGHVWLIDFKVSAKPKSVDALLGAYRTQLELYTWAVRQLGLPGETPGQSIEAMLVSITPRAIQTVPVPLGRVDIVGIAAAASEIVAGAPGIPRPGAACRFCDFREICDEAVRVDGAAGDR